MSLDSAHHLPKNHLLPCLVRHICTLNTKADKRCHYTQSHDSGGVLWFHFGHPCVCLSIHQSINSMSIHLSICISFPDENLNNINGFSPNLVCALIVWRSGLGLLMGKFHHILMELSARDIFCYQTIT